MLGLAGSLRGWGVGSCPLRNLTLLRVGEGQRCLTLEGLARGALPQASASELGNLGQPGP